MQKNTRKVDDANTVVFVTNKDIHTSAQHTTLERKIALIASLLKWQNPNVQNCVVVSLNTQAKPQENTYISSYNIHLKQIVLDPAYFSRDVVKDMARVIQKQVGTPYAFYLVDICLYNEKDTIPEKRQAVQFATSLCNTLQKDEFVLLCCSANVDKKLTEGIVTQAEYRQMPFVDWNDVGYSAIEIMDGVRLKLEDVEKEICEQAYVSTESDMPNGKSR